MLTRDLLEEIYFGVTANKVRSGLTMLGIVIGIASVITMLAVGEGAKRQIESNIQSIGSNLLLVMPGAPRGTGTTVSTGRGSGTSLTVADAEALRSVSGIAAIAPESSRRYQIIAGGKNTNTSVMGTSPAYLQVRNIQMDAGTFFSASQVTSRARVAVLGPTVATDLFGENAAATGKRVRINGVDFSVIGITKAKGGSGFTNQDDLIFVPISTMQTFLSGGESVSTISIQAESANQMTTVQEAATAALLTRHRIQNAAQADFSILNQSDIVAAASTATNTFTILLASIAGISLLVGGIGIMNMMLTTVTERTREIGLRQAIGAEKMEIVSQFLGEAIFLTVCGGAMGVGLGLLASSAAASLAQLPAVVSQTSVLLAFGVSAVIGLVFGFYPAYRAAQLHPIQALKYE